MYWRKAAAAEDLPLARWGSEAVRGQHKLHRQQATSSCCFQPSFPNCSDGYKGAVKICERAVYGPRHVPLVGGAVAVSCLWLRIVPRPRYHQGLGHPLNRPFANSFYVCTGPVTAKMCNLAIRAARLCVGR